MEEYTDFSELTVVAQRIFVLIERELYSHNVKEIHLTKLYIAWRLGMSIPNVKLGLRLLKEKKYIIPKNKNSSVVRVNEIYAYKEKR